MYKTTAQLLDLTYANLNHWVSTTQTTHSTGINYPVELLFTYIKVNRQFPNLRPNYRTN